MLKNSQQLNTTVTTSAYPSYLVSDNPNTNIIRKIAHEGYINGIAGVNDMVSRILSSTYTKAQLKSALLTPVLRSDLNYQNVNGTNSVIGFAIAYYY